MKIILTILNIITVGNVQIDFLLGCFFREDVTQNRNSGDVVGPEVAFSFAEGKNNNPRRIQRAEFCQVPWMALWWNNQNFFRLLRHSNEVLPVRGFQLGPEKSVAEIESDVLSCRRFVRDLWQTENHPGVDLSETELSHQTESVHWPAWRWSDGRRRKVQGEQERKLKLQRKKLNQNYCL